MISQPPPFPLIGSFHNPQVFVWFDLDSIFAFWQKWWSAERMVSMENQIYVPQAWKISSLRLCKLSLKLPYTPVLFSFNQTEHRPAISMSLSKTFAVKNETLVFWWEFPQFSPIVRAHGNFSTRAEQLSPAKLVSFRLRKQWIQIWYGNMTRRWLKLRNNFPMEIRLTASFLEFHRRSNP